MSIKVNVDTDADAILLNYQGRLIPTPTRLAIDDSENLQGGATQGGGSNASGTSGGNIILTNQQNFSSIQENPVPCLRHGTMLRIIRPSLAVDTPNEVWVQDLQIGDHVYGVTGMNTVADVKREWCWDIWKLRTIDFALECSSAHRVITGETDYDGTPVSDLKVGDWLQTQQGPQIIGSKTKMIGGDWVYRVMLQEDKDPKAHWFYAEGILNHNVKRGDEQQNL